MKTPKTLIFGIHIFLCSFLCALHLPTLAIPTHQSPSFIENKGQWPEEVLYYSVLGGMDAWIVRDGIIYDFYKLERVESTEENADDFDRENEVPEFNRFGQVVRQRFVGAQELSSYDGHGKQQAYHNYFHGNDPSKWVSRVGLFSEVVLKDIYPNIDLRFYFDKGQLRYDLILHPGADPEQIRIRFEGTHAARIDSGKDLVLDTRFGEIRQSDLFAYQIVAGIRTHSKCSYFIQKSGDLGFKLRWKDRSTPFIIDPIISATYFGGTSSETVTSMDIDSSDNILIAGFCITSELPTYSGEYNSSENDTSGWTSFFFSKITSDCENMIFYTSIGGNNTEVNPIIRVDAFDEVFIGGVTSSDDYPTTAGAFSLENSSQFPSSNEDVVITKFNYSGDEIIYSTYLGAENDEQLTDLLLTSNSEAIVVGRTESLNFPFSSDALSNIFDGNQCFITELEYSGSSLIYSTSLGSPSNGFQRIQGACTDENDNVYLCGQTYSQTFPITDGAYDDTYGGQGDGFVLKFSPSFDELLYSSYIGGGDTDMATALVHKTGYGLYVTGWTESSDLYITSECFDESYNGEEDMFVLRLRDSDGALDYSTFLGGEGMDKPSTILVDCSNSVLVYGWSRSTNLPTLPDGVSSVHTGETDVVLFKLSSTLDELMYGTYFIGSSIDLSAEMNISLSGHICIAGTTTSQDFVTTAAVLSQEINESLNELEFPDSDGFILKMDFCPTAHVYSNAPFCEGGTLQLSATGGNTYSWTGPDGFQAIGSEVEVVNPVSGTYLVSAASGGTVIDVCTGNGSCTDTASVYVEVYALPEVSFLLADTICVESGNLNLAGGIPAGGTYTGAGITGNTFSPQNAGVGNHILQYNYTDEHGCSNMATAEVAVLVCTDVEELDNRISPTIFPNPFKDEIQLSSSEFINQIRIYNGIGELVHQQKVEKSIFTLNLEHLESGIYTIEVDVISGKKYSERLVKG